MGGGGGLWAGDRHLLVISIPIYPSLSLFQQKKGLHPTIPLQLHWKPQSKDGVVPQMASDIQTGTYILAKGLDIRSCTDFSPAPVQRTFAKRGAGGGGGGGAGPSPSLVNRLHPFPTILNPRHSLPSPVNPCGLLHMGLAPSGAWRPKLGNGRQSIPVPSSPGNETRLLRKAA